MSVICWAVRQATGVEVTGLCTGVYHVQLELADFVGAPRAEISALAAGLNHFTWVYDLRRNGRDAWPLARDRLAREDGRRTPAAARLPQRLPHTPTRSPGRCLRPTAPTRPSTTAMSPSSSPSASRPAATTARPWA